MIGMILAGGGGTRLWPFSRTQNPKQFLNLGSTDVSLLQETYQRLTGIIPLEKIYVIGAKAHEFELKRQMERVEPRFPVENILLEPMSRNTAPAILWGVSQLPTGTENEVVIILPADHLIQKEKEFTDYLKQGASLAKEGWLVTFGVKPDRPETGYGYIKAGKSLKVGHEVESFVEKPNKTKAKEYLKDSSFTWNAGIFLGTSQVWKDAFEQYTPQMSEVFQSQARLGKNLNDEKVIEEVYKSIVSDSIDYAIMEKAARVAVLPVDMDWSDLGSWESIHQMSPKDPNGNVIRGNVITQDTKNSLIFSSKKLVTSIGVQNLVIVETDDALLISDLSRSQDVKKLVQTLKEAQREETNVHTTVQRPWGSYTTLYQSPNYKIKILELLPGKRMSVQRHQHRSEHWVVVRGTAQVTRGDEMYLVAKDQSTFILPTQIHRLANTGKVPLQIIEVQLGDYVGEDDIERFEDDYGRPTSQESETP